MPDRKDEIIETLQNEVAVLKQKLDRRSEEFLGIRNAAQKVLEKDKEKSAELARLVEENRQKETDLERLKAAVSHRDTVSSELEENVANLSHELETTRQKHSAELAVLKRNIEVLGNQLSDKEAELQCLKAEFEEQKIDFAKRLAASSEVINSSVSVNSSLNESEGALLAGANAALKSDLANVEQEKKSCLERIQVLESQVKNLQNKLQLEQQARQDSTDRCGQYEFKIEEYKKMIDELNNELLEMRCDKVSKKGNSMFSEFVDERLKLEQDLLKLKAQNDALIRHNESKDLEIDNLRQELMFTFSRGTADNTPTDTLEMQKEIWALRSENEALKQSLSEEDVKHKVLAPPGASGNSLFLTEANISLRGEIKALNRKLSEVRKSRDLCFDKVNEYENRLNLETTKVKKLELEVQNLQRKLRREVMKNETHKASNEESGEMVEKIPVLNWNEETDLPIANASEEVLPFGNDSGLQTNSAEQTSASNSLSRSGFVDEKYPKGASTSPQLSPFKKRILSNNNESLPVEKRKKQVVFNDEDLNQSTGANSSMKVRSFYKRRAKKPLSNVVESDVNKVPECKQQ